VGYNLYTLQLQWEWLTTQHGKVPRGPYRSLCFYNSHPKLTSKSQHSLVRSLHRDGGQNLTAQPRLWAFVVFVASTVINTSCGSTVPIRWGARTLLGEGTQVSHASTHLGTVAPHKIELSGFRSILGILADEAELPAT
jgi:hypothetical protein